MSAQTADLADGGRPRHRTDAEDDGAEDDRGDDHLDECYERCAQGLERDAGFGGDEPDGGAGDDRDDDHDVEPVCPIFFRCGAPDSGVLAAAALSLSKEPLSWCGDVAMIPPSASSQPHPPAGMIARDCWPRW